MLPSPTADAAPTEVTWSSIGLLGGSTFVHSVDEPINWFVGSAGGYFAAQQTEGSKGHFASRVWFSPDGKDWHVLRDFDPDDHVRALATNGDQVLALVYARDGTATAWLSSDGESWQHADLWHEEDLHFPSTYATAWWGPGGWHAALIVDFEFDPPCSDEQPYGCSRVAIFRSEDGLAWRQLGDFLGYGPGSGATAADGTLLLAARHYEVEAAFMMRSSDDGATWHPIEAAGNCPGTEPALLVPSPRYGRSVLLYDGGQRICGSTDFEQWEEIELPGSSMLTGTSHWLVETDIGLLASSDRFCNVDDSDCPPMTEQFFSTDGTSWAPVELPAELEDAAEMSVADGPAGVIGLASSSDGSRHVQVWRLVGEGR